MSKEQVIAKGKYSHAQPDSLIGVKQYIFVRGEDGKKRLLIRFNNNRMEKCSKFAFILCRLDTKGNVLGEEKYECSGREYREKEVFSFDRKVEVEERCTDFVVKMIYARYGNYTYHVENNEVSVSYDERNNDRQRRKGANKAKPRKIGARSFEMSWTFAIISLLILAIAFAATGFLLRDYMDTKKEFSLSGVHYEFYDKEKKEVIVTGCSDNYREIELTAEIDDGYKVVGIEKGAFKRNNNLRKISINGINIDAEAFSGCSKLEVVTISNVTNIGEKAFYNCSNLESVTVTEGKKGQTLTIGSCAFGNCDELLSVEINQTLIYGEKNDFFSGSKNIETLKLRNFAYAMEGVNSVYVTKLNTLFGETSSNSSSSKLKTLEIANIDKKIPDGFVYGFSKLETVNIINTEIDSIGKNAFRDCKSLTALNSKQKISSIGEYAFANTKITSIDLTNVTSLGSSAFRGAAQLSQVKGYGASGINYIPQYAFEGCKSLKSFNVSENVKQIYKGAFKNSGLTSFTLPEGVACGNGILEGCDSLESLKIYELGTAGFVGYFFGVEDSSSNSSTMADKIPHSLKTVTLDSGVEINAHAFKGCSSVERINLPEGVVAFGDYAFAGCESLKTIDIPSTTLKRIGQFAFYETAIESIELPTTLEYIGYGALSGCDSLKYLTIPFLGEVPNLSDGTVSHVFAEDIPSSLTNISLVPNTQMVSLPSYAFANCTGATTINVPNTVSIIGEGAFYNCGSLVYVDLSQVTSIGRSAFSGCKSLTAVQLSSSLINIGNEAFKETALAVLDIPSSVQVVGSGILEDCKNITSLSVPYLGSTYESTGDAYVSYFFGGGRGEDIPDSLVSVSVTKPFVNNAIPNSAFYNCDSVVNISIPSGYTSVGESAFQNCTNLTSFDFSGVLTIGNYAFYNSGIASAAFDENLYSIGSYAFESCDNLTYVDLPEGISSIGSNTFKDTALTEITIPDSVTDIGAYAFAGIDVTEFVFPSTVNNIGWGVLSGCESIEKLTLPITQGIADSYSTFANYLFEGYFPESLKSVIINGDSVGYLPDSAFAYSAYLEEVIINVPLYSVGYDAFIDCSNLRYVSFTKGVDYVYSGAFDGCYHLYEVTTGGEYYDISSVIEFTTSKAPTVTTDKGYTFSRLNGEWYLVNYPDEKDINPDSSFYYQGSLISSYHIPNYLFYDKDSIETAVFSSAVLSLGEKAFYDCNSLKSVKFQNNNSVTEIKENTFAYCYNLTEVTLPDSVKTIGDYAFDSCGELVSVTFPRLLERIGNGAFYDCSKLNNVKLYENVVSIGDSAFYQCYELYDVYNSSALGLTAGEYGYGDVARFAVRIHTDMNEASSVEVYISGKGTFRRSGGHWLLIEGDDTKNIVLESFKHEDTTVSSYRIKESAFAYCYNIEVLTVGNAVKQIQKNAFVNCSNLVTVNLSSNSSLKKLEYATFANCSSLRYVTLPSTVEKLGDSVFYNCYMLESIEMPTELKIIGAFTFQYCERLISVTLYENVEEIGTDAFANCDQLFEVYDLSPYINVSKNSSNYGMVAYNADSVFTSKSNALERHEQNGLKFIKTSSFWYLYSFTDNGEETVTIPNLGSGLVILPRSMYNGTFTNLILPTNLKSIRNGAFDNCFSFVDMYYQGNSEQWYSVSDEGDYSYFKTLYYYGSCVHYDSYRTWTFDSNGNVTTEMCKETSNVTKEPTCYTTGVTTYKCACSGCDYSRTSTIDKTKHDFVNNVCKICNDTRVNIDGTTVEKYKENGILSIIDFLYDSDSGYFVSQNKEDESMSSFIVTAKSRMTVNFTIQASSESYDYVTVYVNGLSRGRVSGKSSYSFSELLQEGDVLTITYKKDISGAQNNDCGYIKDLNFVLEVTE